MKSICRTTMVLLLSALSLACLGSTQPATRSPAEPVLRLTALVIDRFSVVAQPVGRAQVQAGGEDLSWTLAEWATREAEKSVLQRQVAASVQRANAGGGEKQPRLSGEVVIPVSLPSNLKGLSAAKSSGSLAVASVRLVDGEGRTLGQGTASVDWDGVRWLTGARYRRPRPVNNALVDAARKAVDLAIRDLRQSLGG
jgi:hypothetical protein